jgi:transcriptional antiterminator NusG
MLLGVEKLHRILNYDGDCVTLQGDDLSFAQWVYQYKGKIGVSKAMMVGDRIKVFEGPLKDYEGVIKKVNKQRRSTMVEVSVGSSSKNIWLAFEWIVGEPALVGQLDS